MTSRMVRSVSNQVFGLVLMTATALIMLAVTVFLLDPADAATPAVLTVVLGGATFIVWRFDTTWAAILGLLVAIAAALTVFYIAFGIFQPFSPIEFVAGLMLVIGFLFAVIGGVAALIRRRRGSESGGAHLRRGALVLLAVGAFLSVGGFLLTRATVDAAEASGAVVVDMSDFSFEPQDAAVAAGEQLLFTNSGEDNS